MSSDIIDFLLLYYNTLIFANSQTNLTALHDNLKFIVAKSDHNEQ